MRRGSRGPHQIGAQASRRQIAHVSRHLEQQAPSIAACASPATKVGISDRAARRLAQPTLIMLNSLTAILALSREKLTSRSRTQHIRAVDIEPDVPVSEHPAQASPVGWRAGRSAGPLPLWQWWCVRRGSTLSDVPWCTHVTMIVLGRWPARLPTRVGFVAGLRRGTAWPCRSRTVRPGPGRAAGRCC